MDGVGAETDIISTVSVDGLQLPLLITQTNLLVPIPKASTVVPGLLGAVIVPLPDASIQVPVPTVGVLPLSVAVEPHTNWSTPALAVVVTPLTVIIIVSDEGEQGELEIVHTNLLVPVVKPVTVDVELEALLNVPVPVVMLHAPVPLAGVLAANDADGLHTI